MKRKILTLLLMGTLNMFFFNKINFAEIVPFNGKNFSAVPIFSRPNIQPRSENFSIKNFEHKIYNIFKSNNSEKNMPERKILTASGSCGENATWNFDTNTGVLTISGSGAMDDYSYNLPAPWAEYCSYIKSLTIEPGITSIGDEAFHHCRQLSNVTIPDSVTSIGNSAVNDCDLALRSIIIPDKVTSIGEYAFERCYLLSSITIPANVKSIGTEAFGLCFKLMEINVDPDNSKYKSIDGVLFSKDESELIRYPAGKTGSYTIPKNVKTIYSHAFDRSLELTSVIIPAESVTTIGYFAFDCCKSLKSIEFSNGVKNIGMCAFENCSGLTSIIIPNSVTSIGQYAFSYCDSLTSITIPGSVVSIGPFAFKSCMNLSSVNFGGNEEPSNNGNVFDNCPKLTKIKVPRGYKNQTFGGIPIIKLPATRRIFPYKNKLRRHAFLFL